MLGSVRRSRTGWVLRLAGVGVVLCGCNNSTGGGGNRLTARAGSDQESDAGGVVTLSAGQSSAPSGQTLTYQWVQTGGHPVLLDNAASAQASFVAPFSTGAQTYTFRLTVTSSSGQQSTDDVVITVPASDTIFSTGLTDPDPADFTDLPQALLPPTGASMPASFSLTQYLPPMGNQGTTKGSCTAWASGYAAATYSARVVTPFNTSQTSNQASPEYLYYFLLKESGAGCGLGTDIRRAMDILVRRGCSSLMNVPYSHTQCLIIDPDSADAAKFKIGSYKLLGNTRTPIRNEIAAGRIVVIGASLYTDFFEPGAGVYRGNGILMLQGQQHAAHAMAVVGYDDSKSAFRIMNSWGDDWGENGFIWMHYDTFEALVFLAISVTPAGTPGPVDGDDAGNDEPRACDVGYVQALNDPAVCCPQSYPYIWADGYCYATAPDESEGTCQTGYEVAVNNPGICCPSGYLYDGGDGYCYTDPPKNETQDDCATGYSPAVNYPSICCPDGYAYYGDDGYCHDVPQDTPECNDGYSSAQNNPDVCCPEGYPFDGGDGLCYQYPPDSSTCGAGYSAAVNEPSVCCPTGYPYYGWDGLCHDTDPKQGGNCPTGFAEALNDPSTCCPLGYPYTGFDGYCYESDPYGASQCPPGYSPAYNNPSTCCPYGYPYDGFDGLCYTLPRAGAAQSVKPLADDSVARRPSARIAGSHARRQPRMRPGTQPFRELSCRQVRNQAPDGAALDHLVLDATLSAPIDLKRVSVEDPGGRVTTMSYATAFSSGYVYFTRSDGLWLPGVYDVRFEGLDASGRRQTVSGTAHLPAMPESEAKRLARDNRADNTSGCASSPVYADNGRPANVGVRR